MEKAVDMMIAVGKRIAGAIALVVVVLVLVAVPKWMGWI